MSRIGNLPITLPSGVTCEVTGQTVKVTGPKGTLSLEMRNQIHAEVKDNVIHVTRENDLKASKQLHGTTRANINNLVVGVSTGYSKKLVVVGTGYKTELQGKDLVLYVGYSNPVHLTIPSDIKVEVSGNNNTEITVSGIDKQHVGQFAALVREVRLPEPYKGKGIAYTTEHIRRKEGKKAGK